MLLLDTIPLAATRISWNLTVDFVHMSEF
jgi:hypothetical protein